MIGTERLLLRHWRDADLDPFAAICADPVVMATLGAPLSRDQTWALIERMRETQLREGHCFWAVERRTDGRMIGWCGVIRGSVEPIAGKIELGWRLASDVWGRGYATEAARASLAWCMTNRPGEERIWAITAAGNARSRAVMERLNMTHQADLDFDHSALPDASPLKRHVAYSIARP